MGTSTSTANSILKLFFTAVAIANIADNAGSSPATNIYYGLASADPGAGGTQNTSEIAYTSYARVAVARTTGGHTVTTNSCSPVAAVTFPTGTGGSGTAAFFTTGMLSSGAGIILWSGTVTPNIVTGNTITPQLSTATTIVLV